MPATMARFRARAGNNNIFWVGEEVSILSTLFSPEMIDEAGRIRGGAVALTGVSKEHGPEVVGILQAGDSNLPTLYMRAYLTFSQVQVVGEVNEFQIFLPVPDSAAALLQDGAELPAKRIAAEPNVLTVDWAAAQSQAVAVLA